MKEAIDNTIEMISGLRDGVKADSMIKGIDPTPLILAAIAGEEAAVISLGSAVVSNFTSRHASVIPDAVDDGVKLANQIMKVGTIPEE